MVAIAISCGKKRQADRNIPAGKRLASTSASKSKARVAAQKMPIVRIGQPRGLVTLH
jgi:hypothetical protein